MILSKILLRIFLLVLLYEVVKAIIAIVEQKKCPHDEDLEDVVLGRVKKNTKIADKVIRHLGICEKCQERVREIGSD